MNFIIAGAVSAAIVLVSPFMGQLQSFLRHALTTRQYVLLFGAVVSVAVVVPVAVAFARIRERRMQRLALIGAALAFGAFYMWENGTPYAEVNAVERVHLVEYGLIALLFYQAVRRRDANDVALLLLPALFGFIVGTCDEFLQWFIPVRVGEAHDVFMNLAAIACGLMFAFAVEPPAVFSWTASPRSLRKISITAAAAWLLFATFVGFVHLGYENGVPGIGRFRSHYTVDQLIALQKDRLNRWNAAAPRVLHRLSQEDQYLDEGLWHLRARNTSEPFASWHENLILERYFAPVLDIPTYATPTPNRWPIEQRRNVDAAAVNKEAPFESTAEPYPIVAWPKGIFWSTVAGIALMLTALPLLWRRAEGRNQVAHARVDVGGDLRHD